jgi:hypothetical protein
MNAIDLAAKNIIRHAKEKNTNRRKNIDSVISNINHQLKKFEYELKIKLYWQMHEPELIGLNGFETRDMGILTSKDVFKFFQDNGILSYYRNKGFSTTIIEDGGDIFAYFIIDPNYKPPLWRRILSWFY